MIQVLPENLVNRIAAGEVIVRPASVVKELVENSIDAGATTIRVEVANQCRDILVRDDGCGMDRSDAQLALVQHATSKIREFDDLYQLTTRGFRGEALASIASVSRLQILTRRRGDIAGTKISAEGPGEPRIEAAGAPEGTEVRIRELFYNTPARLKFLKSPASELQQIFTTIMRQALIQPKLGFTIVRDRDTLLHLPPDQPWDERIAALLGSGIHENLLEVDEERHGIHVRGFVLRPAITRKDRRQQFLFVNGRPVASRGISFVLQEAYKGILMVQRFPICVLDLTIPAGEVDVNVHPTKEEVRFRNESLVNGVVHKVVHARLQAANLMPSMSLEGTSGTTSASGSVLPGLQAPRASLSTQPDLVPTFHVPSSGESDGGRNMPVDFGMFTAGLQTRFVPESTSAMRQVAQITAADRETAALQEMETNAPAVDPNSPAETSADDGSDASCAVRPLINSVRRLEEPVESPDDSPLVRNGTVAEPLGQIGRCYIVAQLGHDLLLIDQHAAHERLLYLKFNQQRGPVSAQPLLIPVSVDIPATGISYMERLLPVFSELGLKIEHFGGQTYLVQSVPADLPRMNPSAVVADLLDDFEALGKIGEVEVLRDRIITRMACRAAVKAGQSMHLSEMRQLIQDITHARLGFTCPHGRPTMILLTRDQLDRQFKRKL